jgi:hypothetical protein
MKKDWTAYGIYTTVALLVLLPMLRPGFILTLDMIFVPELPMPEALTSSWPFHSALHFIGMIVPADILQKIMLLAILLLSGIGMHRLVRSLVRKDEIDFGIYLASIVYMVNPFTYSRFMAGQYAVLLGYALLPWVARAILTLAYRPNAKNALKLGLLVTLVGVVSIHTLVAVGVLAVAGIAVGWKKFRRAAKFAAVAAGLFILLSSYWLVPLALGQGKTAATIGNFSAADVAAFATGGGNIAAQVGNVLRLQGFWAENAGLFLLPQDRMVLWGLMSLVIIGLAITGGIVLYRTRPKIVLWLSISGLCGLVASLIFWPGALREPQKMVMLLALTYGVFLAIGANAALARVREEGETWFTVTAVGLLVLPFMWMRVMFWGFDGQLEPRQYPVEWTEVKERLSRDDGQGQVLMLPWHQYMTFRFAGRVIANPASAFYGERAVVSQDPEMSGASGGINSKRQKEITDLLKDRDNFAQNLADHNIGYILLAEDLDYRDYDYLNHQQGISLIKDYPSLKLYEVRP